MDYNENFFLVIKMISLWVLIALIDIYDHEIHQMDVKITFLHNALTEKIYMHQPLGFEQLGTENKVCWLLHIIYGLQQSTCMWYECFNEYLLQVGFLF